MTFGDGTHLKGNTQHSTLDFYTKVKCGESGENFNRVPSTPKGHPKRERET